MPGVFLGPFYLFWIPFCKKGFCLVPFLVKAALEKEVDAFADAITQKILGRAA
jgi:hypothetical protein